MMMMIDQKRAPKKREAKKKLCLGENRLFYSISGEIEKDKNLTSQIVECEEFILHHRNLDKKGPLL